MRSGWFPFLLLTTVLVLPAVEPPASDPVWVEVSVRGSEDEVFVVIGRLDPVVYGRLTEETTGRPGFLRLTDCRFFDEEKERYVPWRDDEDLGEVLVPTDRITEIIRKRDDPLRFPITPPIAQPEARTTPL
jgi:hypothetical protein